MKRQLKGLILLLMIPLLLAAVISCGGEREQNTELSTDSDTEQQSLETADEAESGSSSTSAETEPSESEEETEAETKGNDETWQNDQDDVVKDTFD